VAAPEAPQSGAANPARSALLCRCPRCGVGKLFHGTFTLSLAPACTSCGLDYHFADPGDGPAVFGILILGAVVLGAAMVAEFKYGAPLWAHVVLWGVTTPILAMGLLRWLKAGLVVLQFKNKAGEGRTA
jgi:uncharacterized protein (DUF983 family)